MFNVILKKKKGEHVPSKKFDAIYKHGKDKQSCALLCQTSASPAWVWRMGLEE